MKIGLIGCGAISDIYARNLREKFMDRLCLAACADRHADRAAALAETYGAVAKSVEQVLDDESIDAILNLTIPASHYDITKRAMEKGKHVYSEKPLALSLDQGEELFALARKKELYLAAAPDTFLGGGFNTVRQTLAAGRIGTPVSVSCNLLARGPEGFHPRPERFYQPGGGPLMDMGPYYVTALVSLFGPVCQVCGFSSRTGDAKVCAHPSRAGESFPVETDTTVHALLRFDGGLTASLRMSWDLHYPYWKSQAPLMEIRGTQGTLLCPDPNCFGGSYGAPFEPETGGIHLLSPEGERETIPLNGRQWAGNERGLGLWQAAGALARGEKPRVNAELSLHVLEVLLAILASARRGEYQAIRHGLEKP